jgi:hypothetical protein
MVGAIIVPIKDGSSILQVFDSFFFFWDFFGGIILCKSITTSKVFFSTISLDPSIDPSIVVAYAWTLRFSTSNYVIRRGIIALYREAK